MALNSLHWDMEYGVNEVVTVGTEGNGNGCSSEYRSLSFDGADSAGVKYRLCWQISLAASTRFRLPAVMLFFDFLRSMETLLTLII